MTTIRNLEVLRQLVGELEKLAGRQVAWSWRSGRKKCRPGAIRRGYVQCTDDSA